MKSSPAVIAASATIFTHKSQVVLYAMSFRSSQASLLPFTLQSEAASHLVLVSGHTCDTILIDPNKRLADQIIGVRFEEHLSLQVGHCDLSRSSNSLDLSIILLTNIIVTTWKLENSVF